MIQYKDKGLRVDINPHMIDVVGPILPNELAPTCYFPVSVNGTIHTINCPTQEEAEAKRAEIVAEVDRTNKAIKR